MCSSSTGQHWNCVYMHHEFCRRHDGRVRGGDSGFLNRKQSAGTGVLRTYASWRCSRRCSSCRRRRNRLTWRQQLPSYVTKDALFCCPSSTCNPYDMLTSSKSHIAHSLTTHLPQSYPFSVSLSLQTSLLKVCGSSSAEVALCLTLYGCRA